MHQIGNTKRSKGRVGQLRQTSTVAPALTRFGLSSCNMLLSQPRFSSKNSPLAAPKGVRTCPTKLKEVGSGEQVNDPSKEEQEFQDPFALGEEGGSRNELNHSVGFLLEGPKLPKFLSFPQKKRKVSSPEG